MLYFVSGVSGTREEKLKLALLKRIDCQVCRGGHLSHLGLGYRQGSLTTLVTEAISARHWKFIFAVHNLVPAW